MTKLSLFGLWAATTVLSWCLGVYSVPVVNAAFERQEGAKAFIRANCKPWFRDSREHSPDASKDKRIPYMRPGIIMGCTAPKELV